LDLSAERQAAMVPLLDARLKAREAAAADSGRPTTLTRHARDLVRIDPAAGKSFADFAAFDLSLDDSAADVLTHIRSAVPATDLTGEQLTCLWHLICLEPNPEAVSAFLRRSFPLLSALEGSARGGELPGWLGAYRALADRLRDTRPDVADSIAAYLAAFCTPARAAWIADLALTEPDGKQAAGAVVEALGPAVAAPLVTLLEGDGDANATRRTPTARPRAVAQLLTEHAVLLGPALAPLLAQSTPGVVRTLLRVLGAAGAGYEEHLASYVSARDEATAREALRALARIGTARAASLVVAEIEKQRGSLSAAAEETLWHFPVHEAQRHTRELLGRRGFATKYPETTERLLDRAARSGAGDLQPVLEELAPLRFRIWNPSLARVARKAHAMLKTPARP
jgi:hypothetical protein